VSLTGDDPDGFFGAVLMSVLLRLSAFGYVTRLPVPVSWDTPTNRVRPSQRPLEDTS
jgi:hypothetical protein